MAEETRHASDVIPKAMILSYFINGTMVFIMLITYCFCLTDLIDAFASATGFPFIQVFATATGSAEGAAAISCLLVVLIVFSVTNYMAACSRQVFTFARDRGVPFHTWIAKVRSSKLGSNVACQVHTGTKPSTHMGDVLVRQSKAVIEQG